MAKQVQQHLKENGMQERVGRAAYGVFVGFAPIDDPKIAVCVVIYDGGHGYFSSYVARAIFEAYFKDELQKIILNIFQCFLMHIL